MVKKFVKEDELNGLCFSICLISKW